MIEPTFLRYERRFIEDCVFVGVRGHAEERPYHYELDRLYKIEEQEERERAFQNLNTRWFMRLGLAEPIEAAVSEQPLLFSSVSYCLVARAPGKKEEGAELFVAPKEDPGEGARPTVGILLRPQSLLDAARLLSFLRHELLHIADMLDPGFGYKPTLPEGEGGPTHNRLLKDRYRVLWDTTIDGCMVRRGWAPAALRTDRLAEFAHAFPVFGPETEQLFSHFFNGESHNHAQLVAFAQNPRVASGLWHIGLYPGGRCSLCGFPTYSLEPEPVCLPAEVVTQITRDFPDWCPSDGLCVQCADLYRTCAISARAAQDLPGPYRGSEKLGG